MSGRIVRGVWDCKFCGGKKIDGLADECPHCGRKKSEDVKYYMSGPVEEVSSEEFLKAQGLLPQDGEELHSDSLERLAKTLCDGEHEDWVCNYCNTLNNWADNSCSSCGSPKHEATHEYSMHKLSDANTDNGNGTEFVFNTSELEVTETPANSESSSRNLALGTEENTTADDLLECKLFNPDSNPEEGYIGSQLDKKKRRINWKSVFSFLGIAGIVGFVIWLAIFLFGPIEEIVAVEHKSWNRVVTIEEERTVKEDGWSVPSSGRVYDERQEIRSYVDVIDHYETVTETKSRQVLSHYETVTETKSRQVLSHYDTSVSYRDNGNGTFTEVTNSTPVYETEYYTETHQEPVYKTEYYTETHEEPVYRKEPVYDTKYYYEIEKWFDTDNYESSGVDNEPYWNESYILESNERDTQRSEKYAISYDNGDSKILPFEEWNNINLGDGYVLTKCRLGLTYKVEELDGTQ